MKVNTTRCDLCCDIVPEGEVAAIVVNRDAADVRDIGPGAIVSSLEVTITEACRPCRAKVHSTVTTCVARREWQKLRQGGVNPPDGWLVGGVDLNRPGD